MFEHSFHNSPMWSEFSAPQYYRGSTLKKQVESKIYFPRQWRNCDTLRQAGELIQDYAELGFINLKIKKIKVKIEEDLR